MMFLFADAVTGMGERLAVLVIKLLAVGGGFLFGYLIGLLVARALNRWAFASKAPEALKKLCALVSGVLFAVLVAIVVFGEGGGGLFGSGKGTGDGTDPPSATDKDKGTTEPPEVKEPPKKPPEKLKPPDPKPTPGDLRVTVLAGAEVRDGRFYLFDGDAQPKTLAEFKDAILARQKEGKPLKDVYYRFRADALSAEHPAIRGPQLWLDTLKVSFRPE